LKGAHRMLVLNRVAKNRNEKQLMGDPSSTNTMEKNRNQFRCHI